MLDCVSCKCPVRTLGVNPVKQSYVAARHGSRCDILGDTKGVELELTEESVSEVPKYSDIVVPNGLIDRLHARNNTSLYQSYDDIHIAGGQCAKQSLG